MNARLEAKLNMYHAVEALCDENPATVAMVAAFATSYGAFQTVVSAIGTDAAALEQPRKGFAAAKKKAKYVLAKRSALVASQVYAYAVVTNNEVLRDSMSLSYTHIYTAKDDEAGLIALNIYNAANSLIGSLGDYGTTPALLTDLQNAITDYNSKKPSVRLNINQRKSIREDMLLRFLEADILLKVQMDKLTENYTLLDTMFKEAYDSARVVIDPGVYKTFIRLQVVHSITGEPVKNVRGYMDASPLFKRSSAKGMILYNNPEQGSRRIVLRHRGFREVVLPSLPVNYGSRVFKIVMMEPLFYEPEDNSSPILMERVAHIPANSVVNVAYSFVMHGDYRITVTNPTTSALVGVGFGPDATSIVDPKPVDRGFTFFDTALNLNFSVVNTFLNFRNDTEDAAVVVLTIVKS